MKISCKNINHNRSYLKKYVGGGGWGNFPPPMRNRVNLAEGS